jgi:hypothetical protein
MRKRLLPGKTRPAIYYTFDCRVELSDGSTYLRRSVFPKVEMRYLLDARNNPDYNPSRPNVKLVAQDASGKLASFKRKFGDFDSTKSGESNAFLDMMEQNHEPLPANAGKYRPKKKK